MSNEATTETMRQHMRQHIEAALKKAGLEVECLELGDWCQWRELRCLVRPMLAGEPGEQTAKERIERLSGLERLERRVSALEDEHAAKERTAASPEPAGIDDLKRAMAEGMAADELQALAHDMPGELCSGSHDWALLAELAGDWGHSPPLRRAFVWGRAYERQRSREPQQQPPAPPPPPYKPLPPEPEPPRRPLPDGIAYPLTVARGRTAGVAVQVQAVESFGREIAGPTAIKTGWRCRCGELYEVTAAMAGHPREEP